MVIHPQEENWNMPAHKIADKFRRALRNETGATFDAPSPRKPATSGQIPVRIKRTKNVEIDAAYERALSQRSGR